MRQTWHIFQKDVRYLRNEIALLLALATMFGWMSTRGPIGGAVSDALEPLFAAAIGYTIARLVHAEALPGENQFWITRPYYWQSLLGAKLLFVLVFVNLPVLIGQAVVLMAAGFPIAFIVPGLLWTQVLILICVVLPFTALAALTNSMVQFIGSPLATALVGFCVLYFGIWFRINSPAPMEWLRDSIIFIALAVIAPSVLYLQYKFRRTHVSRTLALGVAICSTAAYVILPWGILFPVQARLSKQSFDSLQVTRDSRVKLQMSPGPGGRLDLDLPVLIGPLPDGMYAQIESFALGLEAPDGRRIPIRADRLSMYDRKLDRTLFTNWLGLHGAVWLDPKLLQTERTRSSTLRASFYLTVYGNARDQQIILHRTPTNIMDGLQCYAGMLNQLECAAPFRWPARIVYQRSSGTGKSALTRLISYSPFPANLQLDPIVRKTVNYYSQEPPPADRPVTIEVEEPLAYLRRDLIVPLQLK